MRALLLLTAFFVVFFPHFGHAEEAGMCEITNEMNVCSQPEPYVCESASNYPSPNDFAQAHGGVLTSYQPYDDEHALMRVSFYEGQKLKANYVFRFSRYTRDICLVVIATPLKQPSGMAL